MTEPKLRIFNSRENAAAYCGVSKRHFDRIAETLGIESFMFGRSAKYSFKDVQRIKMHRLKQK